MASLKDLNLALSRAIADGGGTKVYFYAVSANSAALRHGYIAVVDALTCQVNFEGGDDESVLAQIAELDFVKVDTLSVKGATLHDPARPSLDARHVLNLLDPVLHARVVVPRAEPPMPAHVAPAHGVAPAAVAPPAPMLERPAAAAPTLAAPTPPALDATKPAIRLINVQLKDMAMRLLEPYFGTSTIAKVEEIARMHSPIERPERFLQACEQAASMFVGMKKAAEAFAPAWDKLKEA